MARVFRFKKAIPVDYDLQGYIYFTSRRFKDLPAGKQKRIKQLCQEAAGDYAQALFEFVTTDDGATAVCTRHFLSCSTLERMVRRYYVAFADKI